MPKYNEATITGEVWTRAFQVLISNEYNKTPYIRYDEEEAVLLTDNKVIRNNPGSFLLKHLYPEEANVKFQLRNPLTEEYIDKYATYQDMYVLIHSLYFHLTKIRDFGPPPYPSWQYNSTTNTWEAPVPMPTDGQSYVWYEPLQIWVIEPPYPSWQYNPTTGEWEAPRPMPTDGQSYIWNEETQLWDIVI